MSAPIDDEPALSAQALPASARLLPAFSPAAALSGLLTARPRALAWTTRGATTVGAFALFLVALRAMVLSARGLRPVLEGLGAAGALNLIGFGWLSAYLVLSGSPVAATSLTLLDSGVITPLEAFGQIVGSRMGASFVVLFVGFLYYLRGHRLPASAHVGIVALLVTMTTMAPVAALGVAALHWGWFDGLHLHGAVPLVNLVQEVADPALTRLARWLPAAVLFFVGVGLMLSAFKIFDRVLPTPKATADRLARVDHRLRSPWTMFLLGGAVTLATLSVSLSLTLLVPLALRGAIRRDAIIPFVLGANVTTFVDTFAASAALERPEGQAVVLTMMILALAVAILVLALAYRPYSRAILWLSHEVSRSHRSLALFVTVIFAIPLVLLLL